MFSYDIACVLLTLQLERPLAIRIVVTLYQKTLPGDNEHKVKMSKDVYVVFLSKG